MTVVVLNNIINALGKFTGDEEVRKSVMQILINCLPGLRNEADMQAILRNARYATPVEAFIPC